MNARSRAAANIAEYSVSELAFALKRTIEDSYGWVRVRGELSGLKRAASGHLYFSLKDEKAVLDAVCWRGTLPKLAFELEDGLEVVCLGRLTTYPQRSRYQLVVESIEPAGIGALLAQLEERRKRLEAEGLFAPERKRPLPFLPAVIGVVTSASGAVIRDILHRLEERFPRRVILWPVLVQGEGAAEQIAAAVRGFAALPEGGPVPRPEVLIVARGGGSIEDLWAFNEEVVVRAVAECPIPVISAVGHETDTTLIDFAADRRAPTPTAAAEMAVPVRGELLQRVEGLAGRLRHAVDQILERQRRHLDGLLRGLRDPELLIAPLARHLDHLAERLRLRSPLLLLEDRARHLADRHRRLAELAGARLLEAETGWRHLAERLRPELVTRRLADAGKRVADEAAKLEEGMRRHLREAARSLETLGQRLESLSHRRVLERGYALVRRQRDGRIVPALAAAGDERAFEIEFVDGRMAVLRAGAQGGSRARRARGGAGERGSDDGQPQLL